MPTEPDVIDQLAGYFAWLEGEIGAPMHRAHIVREEPAVAGEVVPLVGSPVSLRHRGLVTLAAGLVAASLIAAYQLRQSTSTTSVVTAPIESVTSQPVQSSTTAAAVPDTPMVWAPVALPDNLVVWDVGWGRSGAFPGTPSTEQLFGRYDASNTAVEVGLLLRVQDTDREALPDGPGLRTLTVRGVTAVAEDGGNVSTVDSLWMMWVEAGHEFTVQGRGTTVDEAVSMLDAMQARGDGSGSFEPSSATLPLLAEESTGPTSAGDATYFTITGPDGPVPRTGPLEGDVSVASENRAVTVRVGPTTIGQLRPEWMYAGQNRADGSIVSDPGAVLEPDGTAVLIYGSTDGLAAPSAILDAFRLVPRDHVATLVGAANDRLARLPEVAAAEFDNARIVLRGGTAAWPLTLCLTVGTTERCRSSRGVLDRANWPVSVPIDGRWYVFGRQPADAPPPIVYPWAPDMPSSVTVSDVAIIEPTQSQVTAGQLLWYAEIPAGIDAVGVGYVEDGHVLSAGPFSMPGTASRRPDSG